MRVVNRTLRGSGTLQNAPHVVSHSPLTITLTGKFWMSSNENAQSEIPWKLAGLPSHTALRELV